MYINIIFPITINRELAQAEILTSQPKDDVYDMIKRIFEMIHTEVEEITGEEKIEALEALKRTLRKYACIPVNIKHPKYKNENNLLASLEIVWRETRDFWWHFPCVNFEESVKPIENGLGIEYGEVAKLSVAKIIAIFSWMSKQNEVYSSIKMMSSIYSKFHDALKEGSEETRILEKMISNDEPFIWIPILSRDKERPDRMCLGRMYSLSRIVDANPKVDDDPDTLDFLECPVRALKDYYNDNYEISNLFVRREVCCFCKLAEGLYSHRGFPASKTIFNQGIICECKKYADLERLSSSGRGLVKSSLSLDNWLSVIKSIQQRLRSPLDDDGQYLYKLKLIYHLINKALSKCYEQRSGIFPYIPSDIEKIVSVWSRELIWPSMFGDWLRFDPDLPEKTLVVEDFEMIRPFKATLSEILPPIRVLDLTYLSDQIDLSDQIKSMRTIKYVPSDANSLSYFESKYEALMQQSTQQIKDICYRRPNLNNLPVDPLVISDLLPNVVKLSSVLRREISHEGTTIDVEISDYFMQLHYVTILSSLAYLKCHAAEHFHQLLGMGQVYTFLDTKIRFVEELKEITCLDLQQFGHSPIFEELVLDHYVEQVSEQVSPSSRILYLSTGSSKKELKKIHEKCFRGLFELISGRLDLEFKKEFDDMLLIMKTIESGKVNNNLYLHNAYFLTIYFNRCGKHFVKNTLSRD